jgi:hypothetical protein
LFSFHDLSMLIFLGGKEWKQSGKSPSFICEKLLEIFGIREVLRKPSWHDAHLAAVHTGKGQFLTFFLTV